MVLSSRFRVPLMPAVGTCPPDPSTGKSLVPPSNCNQKRILLFRLAGGAPAAGAAANQQAGDTCREQREIRRLRYGRSRSEEHTSELPSLMRHFIAGFCLKKQQNNTQHIDVT